jgi:hypothetical protein
MSLNPSVLMFLTHPTVTLTNVLCQASPNLHNAVGALADGVQKSVDPLFRFQTALINSLPSSPESNAILNRFKETRSKLRNEFMSYKSLIQNCCIYFDFYTTVVAAGSAKWPQRTLPKAREVSAEAVKARNSFKELYDQLQNYKDKVFTFTFVPCECCLTIDS